jgi:HD-GYP domain-containing protein (c-di-GMP phosphodiesterase class II)
MRRVRMRPCDSSRITGGSPGALFEFDPSGVQMPDGRKDAAAIAATGAGHDPVSYRAGLLPVAISHLPPKALNGIPVYLRTSSVGGTGTGEAGDSFTLFAAGNIPFDEARRQQCIELGFKFIYIPIACHDRFRSQSEAQIEDITADPKMAAAAKWAIVYETSNEIANELLSQRNFAANLPRLAAVSKSVSSLVLNDPLAFTHLFATSHHDFYTATHMVNVGTWMTALAYAMGHTDETLLRTVFQAGILHDVGKTRIPKEILNKTGALTNEEWASLRSHPALGYEYLQLASITDPIILAVTQQHHERLDASGYPDALTREQLHPISLICAVVDTFDAMTALRPFKSRALTVSEAMTTILNDTPARFDADVVAAFTDLLRGTGTQIDLSAPAEPPQRERRRHNRFNFGCPAMLRIKEKDERIEDAPTLGGTARNISSNGMSILLPVPVVAGQQIRVHLQPPSHKRVANKTYDTTCIRCRAYDDGWCEAGVAFKLG